MLYIPISSYMVIGRPGDNTPLEHEVMQAINLFQVGADQYLCTDAIAIYFHEPCIMCAMALVHSRVQRVYYLQKSEKGAFTFWKLHERSVN